MQGQEDKIAARNHSPGSAQSAAESGTQVLAKMQGYDATMLQDFTIDASILEPLGYGQVNNAGLDSERFLWNCKLVRKDATWAAWETIDKSVGLPKY